MPEFLNFRYSSGPIPMRAHGVSPSVSVPLAMSSIV
jgi:hypothetical protein